MIDIKWVFLSKHTKIIVCRGFAPDPTENLGNLQLSPPKLCNWFQGELRGKEEWRGGLWRKLQKEKGNEKGAERGKGRGRKGNSALVVRNLGYTYLSGVAYVRSRAAMAEQISCILGVTKHFWWIDNVIFHNYVMQHSWVNLTSSGGLLPPLPQLGRNLSLSSLCG